MVVHLDLDCFYAQVEQRRLGLPAHEPIAVQQWGSLLAVNYVARGFGVQRGACATAAAAGWRRELMATTATHRRVHLGRQEEVPQDPPGAFVGLAAVRPPLRPLTSIWIWQPHVDTLGENRRLGEAFDRTHQKAILRRYRVASREIFAVLGTFTTAIEKASIDEAFLDVTDLALKRLADMV